MEQTLQEILTTTLQAIESAGGSEELNQIRVRVLGRKGELTAILRELGKLDKDQRCEQQYCIEGNISLSRRDGEPVQRGNNRSVYQCYTPYGGNDI